MTHVTVAGIVAAVRRGGAGLALVLTLTQAGCGSVIQSVDGMFAPVSGWSKPGVDAAQQRRDAQACDAAAVRAHGPGGAARLAYEHCMRAKGYELAEK